jgi:hypothetical protein
VLVKNTSFRPSADVKPMTNELVLLAIPWMCMFDFSMCTILTFKEKHILAPNSEKKETRLFCDVIMSISDVIDYRPVTISFSIDLARSVLNLQKLVPKQV